MPRLEIMTVDGQKVVRTEKEVELPSKETELAQQQQKTVSPTDKPTNAPTLRRPGEEAAATPAGSAANHPP